MTQQSLTAARPAHEHFQSVHHFLNRQMQLLDEGDAAGWAATFTEEGVFAQDTRPEGRKGRAMLAERMTHHVGVIRRRGLTRRHWLGMLTVDHGGDGTVRARYYAIVVDTPAGGEAALHLSTSCEDVLVPDGDSWLVSYRFIHHDNIDKGLGS
ncbi:nuclear transport factor 2 family protein [Nonomuraea insulae]|uniref:Nuclear transport factor 2 family protein n=1 Tax=Nonomuraea insulae TaxID=1616787 RepID=A0ABW1CQF8_9ACTN